MYYRVRYSLGHFKHSGTFVHVVMFWFPKTTSDRRINCNPVSWNRDKIHNYTSKQCCLYNTHMPVNLKLLVWSGTTSTCISVYMYTSMSCICFLYFLFVLCGAPCRRTPSLWRRPTCCPWTSLVRCSLSGVTRRRRCVCCLWGRETNSYSLKMRTHFSGLKGRLATTRHTCTVNSWLMLIHEVFIWRKCYLFGNNL